MLTLLLLIKSYMIFVSWQIELYMYSVRRSLGITANNHPDHLGKCISQKY